MRYLCISTLALMLGLIMCMEFEWKYNFSYKHTYGCGLQTAVTRSGLVHIFWLDCYGYNVTYQVFYPNGTLSGVLMHFRLETRSKVRPVLSLKASKDGMHLLLAYDNFTVLKEPPNSERNVGFIESFNGGKDWTAPIAMANRDTYSIAISCGPSLIYEEDINRVCIAYIQGKYIEMSCRESGAREFTVANTLMGLESVPHAVSLGYTVDKKNSVRYHHLVMVSASTQPVTYAYKLDTEKWWTSNMEFLNDVKLKMPPPLLTDPLIDKSRVFLQYNRGYEIMLHWSNSSGQNWETPIRVGTDARFLNDVGLCGRKDMGIVVSANVRVPLGVFFVRYMEIHKSHFVNIPYPFTIFTSTGSFIAKINCAFIDNDEYAISYIVQSPDKDLVDFAYGVLKNNTVTQ